MIDNKKLEELRKNGWSWHPTSGGSGSASKYAQPEWGHEVSTGMIDVLPEMIFDYSGEALVELFDTPFPEPLVVGKTYRVTWNGQTVDCVAYEVTGEDGYIGLGRNSFGEGEEPFSIQVFNEVRYEKKYYWQAEGHDGIYPVTVHIATEGEVRAVHKIPGEYVGGVGKYKQPEWGVEDGAEVLAESVIALEDGQAMISAFTKTPTIGNVYTVNWNGTAYTCTAFEFDDGGVSMIALGNGAAFGREDTGEPFSILAVPEDTIESAGVAGMIMALDGTVTLSITGEAVHTIPEKFLEYKEPLFVTLFDDQSTIDKTYEQIKAAIDENRVVTLVAITSATGSATKKSMVTAYCD